MENLSRRILSLSDKAEATALMKVFTDIYERLRCVTLSTAGLVISATTTKVKTGAAICYLSVQGILRSVAAGVDMPVLVGTVTNAKFNVFVFSIGVDGTTYTTMGVEGSTFAAVKWPVVPASRTILGFAIINPTGTGNFVGGTTALGDATVVPNAVYVSPLGAFDPAATVQ
jgi:hypothetical protein